MKLYLEEVKKGEKDYYKEHWEKFQLNMKCCGVNYYTDWTDICKDIRKIQMCQKWKSQGKCSNTKWVAKLCRKTCGVCTTNEENISTSNASLPITCCKNLSYETRSNFTFYKLQNNKCFQDDADVFPDGCLKKIRKYFYKENGHVGPILIYYYRSMMSLGWKLIFIVIFIAASFTTYNNSSDDEENQNDLSEKLQKCRPSIFSF